MKLFSSILSALLLSVAFAAADTTAVKPADSAATVATTTDSSTTDSASIQELKKKHAVWVKLEGDVEPAMFEFCARAIDDALNENPDYIVFEINTFG